MKVIATITAIAFIFTFAWGTVFAGTLTVAAFDLSGSVLKDSTGNRGKDSPLNRNFMELQKRINALGKEDELIVIGFGRKSDVVLLKVKMPRQAGPLKQNLIATREAAVKKLQENLKARAHTVDNSRTDVIGASFRGSRLMEEQRSGAATKRFVLYSDMLDNETIGLSIKRLKPGSHKEFLKRAGAAYPDLKGVEIEIYSAFSDIPEANTVETEIGIKELKLFWGEYFGRSGGVVKSYKTNY